MLRGVTRVFGSSVAPTRISVTSSSLLFNQRWASFVMKVPSMGDSITEGAILNWKKNVGEYVAADEVICEIETDKVTIDVHSQASGVILSHAAQAGETVFVSGDLVTIDTDAAAPAGTPAPKAAAPASTPAAAAPAAAAPAKAASHRVPMIKFPLRGAAAVEAAAAAKACCAKKASGPGYTPQAPVVEAAPAKSNSTTVSRYFSFLDLPEHLRATPLSEAEIEAINGGDYGYTDEWATTLGRKPAPKKDAKGAKDAKKDAPKKK